MNVRTILHALSVLHDQPRPISEWNEDVEDTYGEGGLGHYMTATCPRCGENAEQDTDPRTYRYRWTCFQCGATSEWS